jgi:hypothetical protein
MAAKTPAPRKFGRKSGPQPRKPAPAAAERAMEPAMEPSGGAPDGPHAKDLALMRSRYKMVVERESELREMMRGDLRARLGQLFDDKVRKARKDKERPVVEINKFPQYEHQITGEIRQSEPVIVIEPGDGEGHREVAAALQGRIRHIHARSKAKSARLTAVENAYRTGRGHYRVITRAGAGGKEEIRIERVRNPLSVYIDPLAKQADRSDARWGFVMVEMEADEFKDEFPQADGAGLDLAADGDLSYWIDGRTVRVGEYFYCEGEPGEEDCAWTWWKTNGREVLEEERWPGLWLPILTVVGDEIDLDGKLILEGGIRHAKVPMQMLGYARSTEVESLGLTVKRKMLVTPTMIEGFSVEWANANTSAELALPVNPDPLMQGGWPKEIFPRGPDTGAMALGGTASQDLHDATGMHPANLGQSGPERSGVAIGRRQMEGDTGNFLFTDNLAVAMEHEGRILLDLILKVDVAGLEEEIKAGTALLKTVQENGKSSVVRLARHVGEPQARFEANDVNGKPETFFDPTVGCYEASVTTGPAFASRRQEAAAGMAEVFKAAPLPFLQVAGDLLIELQDWPGADRLAKRFQHLLMPAIQQEIEGGDSGDSAQQGRQAQAMLAKLAPAMQMMQQQLAMAQKALADRNAEMALKHMKIMLDYQAQVIEAKGNVEAAQLNAMGHMGRELARGVATRHAAAGGGAGMPMAGGMPGLEPAMLDAGDPAGQADLPLDEGELPGQADTSAEDAGEGAPPVPGM